MLEAWRGWNPKLMLEPMKDWPSDSGESPDSLHAFLVAGTRVRSCRLHTLSCEPLSAIPGPGSRSSAPNHYWEGGTFWKTIHTETEEEYPMGSLESYHLGITTSDCILEVNFLNIFYIFLTDGLEVIDWLVCFGLVYLEWIYLFCFVFGNVMVILEKANSDTWDLLMYLCSRLQSRS